MVKLLVAPIKSLDATPHVPVGLVVSVPPFVMAFNNSASISALVFVLATAVSAA